ncbi:MAG: type II toxin-antitoxin system RelB/DinJ family antitoxin [Candidatus Electrothrix sp. GM3_4]|nr:type II toxin-antitoxin system RelB/DinJ family antitoxin [Candidatus Electrothrix sp. GM3_4]
MNTANTARVQAQIDKTIKDQGEQILKELGISTAELIRMTFRQLVSKKALPFGDTPNSETLQAFEEGKDPQRVTRYKNAKEAISDMWGEN